MADEQILSTNVVQDSTFENMIANAIKLPGVKVNRTEFLTEMFGNHAFDLQEILDVGPVQAKCPKEILERMAEDVITKRTSQSTLVSFATGIPGGLAMAATIPADTLQFFGVALRMAQEISYLYGGKDMWKDGDVDNELVRSQLILFIGVMFGVADASAVVRLLYAQIAQQALMVIPEKVLPRVLLYPLVKQIGKRIGIKISKAAATKGISKVVPLVGGLISGGMTYATMKPMGKRLAKILQEVNFEYSEEQVQKDCLLIEDLKKSQEDINIPETLF